MDNQDKQVLVKIFNYADSIQNYCVNCNTLSDFIKNKMRTEACAHNLIQISRTCQTELSDQIKSEINSIPWERLCNYQNELEPDSSEDNLNLVWNIVHEDIPQLVDELRKYHREGNAFLDDSQINNPIISIKRFLKRTPKTRLLLFALSCYLFLYPCFTKPVDDLLNVMVGFLALIGVVLIFISFAALVCFPYYHIKSKLSCKAKIQKIKYILRWIAVINIPIALVSIFDAICYLIYFSTPKMFTGKILGDLILFFIVALLQSGIWFAIFNSIYNFIDKQADRTISPLRILNLIIFIPSFFWIALSFICWNPYAIFYSYIAYIGCIIIFYISKRMFNNMQEMIASQTNEAASAKRHDEESNKGPDKGPDEAPDKGPDEELNKGPDEESNKGPDEESNKEPDEESGKGPDEK